MKSVEDIREIAQHMWDGHKIKAIIALREQVKWGLKESKDWVEAQNFPMRPDLREINALRERIVELEEEIRLLRSGEDRVEWYGGPR